MNNINYINKPTKNQFSSIHGSYAIIILEYHYIEYNVKNYICKGRKP